MDITFNFLHGIFLTSSLSTFIYWLYKLTCFEHQHFFVVRIAHPCGAQREKCHSFKCSKAATVVEKLVLYGGNTEVVAVIYLTIFEVLCAMTSQICSRRLQHENISFYKPLPAASLDFMHLVISMYLASSLFINIILFKKTLRISLSDFKNGLWNLIIGLPRPFYIFFTYLLKHPLPNLSCHTGREQFFCGTSIKYRNNVKCTLKMWIKINKLYQQ